MTKYKIINKTYSPLNFTSVGVIPARGSVIVVKLPEGIKDFQKKNMVEVKKVSE